MEQTSSALMQLKCSWPELKPKHLSTRKEFTVRCHRGEQPLWVCCGSPRAQECHILGSSCDYTSSWEML